MKSTVFILGLIIQQLTSFSQSRVFFIDSFKFKGALVVNEISQSIHLVANPGKLLNSKVKRALKKKLPRSSIEIMEPAVVARFIKNNFQKFPVEVAQSKAYFDLLKFYRIGRNDFSILYKKKSGVCYMYPNVECTVGILLVDLNSKEKIFPPDSDIRYYIINFER